MANSKPHTLFKSPNHSYCDKIQQNENEYLVRGMLSPTEGYHIMKEETRYDSRTESSRDQLEQWPDTKTRLTLRHNR